MQSSDLGIVSDSHNNALRERPFEIMITLFAIGVAMGFIRRLVDTWNDSTIRTKCPCIGKTANIPYFIEYGESKNITNTRDSF